MEVTKKVTIARIKQRQKKEKETGSLMEWELYVDFNSSSKYLW